MYKEGTKAMSLWINSAASENTLVAVQVMAVFARSMQKRLVMATKQVVEGRRLKNTL
jgi:hypothetical protein